MKDFHKMKISCLIQILEDYTDETHGITMPEILEKLRLYGIQAERKSIYRDIESINSFGVHQVVSVKAAGGKNYYYLKGKRFALSELKFLTDAVQASHSLTLRESEALIRKLAALGSVHEAKLLRQQARMEGRLKNEQGDVLPYIKLLTEAIQEGCVVGFHYLGWGRDRKLVPCDGGSHILVRPMELCWVGENYCLRGLELQKQELREYRIDRMQGLRRETEEETSAQCRLCRTETGVREAVPASLCGRLCGERMDVRLRVDERAAAVLMDRFGGGIPLIEAEDGFYDTRIHAEVTDHFLCWLLTLQGAQVMGPEQMVERIREVGRSIRARYGEAQASECDAAEPKARKPGGMEAELS